MEDWDPIAFKSLLRTTSQRLGQLQERQDAQGQLARREIAVCLDRGEPARARARAAMLIQEDVMGDLLEELEMQVGMLGSHVGELGSGGGVGLGLVGGAVLDWQGEPEEGGAGRRGGERGGHIGKLPQLSPVLVEAAASIIHAAPSTDSKDLSIIRDILIQRLGPTFAQTASATRNNNVSRRIIQILSSPPPTASKMDEYLVEIAQTHGVKWVPEPRREDLLNVISEILRADGGSSPIVDLPRLREICARGLPDDPPWIRPRIWRLLFGTLPILKTTWAKESQKQRESYYDLVRRVLEPLASLPSPTDPLSPTDALITRISDVLFRVSPDMFALLANEPKSAISGKCPLDATAADAVQIPCASNLDKRLALLNSSSNDTCETPEIRLESEASPPLPSSPPQSSPEASTLASRRQRRPTTLLPSKAYNAPPVHRAHLSALLRLLYLHSTLNPAVQSPHVPWLLVPLYSTLVGETDEDDAAHAEADTFWVFEALVGETAEMEEEGGKVWTRRLSERIKWADGELAASLHATGLDPVLPHYSYRWLAPLLTQTLPLSSVFPVWDVLFARPMRTRDVNPKLEYLVDICTALLVRARTPLFRVGKPGRNALGLWPQDEAALLPPSPLRPWELSDAFTEGIALLTTYPIEAAGGIDRILQTASDLAQKRVEERDRERERERENVGFGARIKQQMWKGFTNQVADGSPEEEEEEEEEEKSDDDTGEHDDGNETETPAAPTLTSRLANTVWRGITNQSSMDDEVSSPPSPLSGPSSPVPSEEQPLPAPPAPSTPASQASLWGYAGKLKDSDTIAAFSKVSTNWRAKALDAWGVRRGSNASASPKPAATGGSTPPGSAASDVSPRQSGWPSPGGADAPNRRRGSFPGMQRESENIVLDPPRPAFFRSPRESFLPQPRRQHATEPPSPNIVPAPSPLRESDTESNTSFIQRASTSLASLATFQSAQSTPKSVPRPLMLNSRDLITTKSPQIQPHPLARSEGNTPEYRGSPNPWGDVSLASKNRHVLRQESVSSISSLSPSEAMNRSPYPFTGGYARSAGATPRSDYESDGSVAAASRKVPLNRKSVSPMALASRSPRLPWNASSPGVGRSTPHALSNGNGTAEEVDTTEEHGWKHFQDRAPSGGSTMGATGFDSPTTISSPPIPRTPLIPAFPGPGAVRIVNGHVGTSSISTLSEASEANGVPLESPIQSKLVARKKTPPLPVRTADNNGERRLGGDGERLTSVSEPEPEPESGDSEMSILVERTPSGKAPVRLRSKRYVPRPGNLRLRPVARTGMSEQLTPIASPGRRSLAPEWPSESEHATTPKNENYLGSTSVGEVVSEDGHGALLSRPPITRKLSKEARSKKETRRTRDSGAEEGDDEGYDDLLSAYESEEGSRE